MQQTGLPGWTLGQVSLDVIDFSAYEDPTAVAASRQGDLSAVAAVSFPGARMIIEVERKSKAFYIVIVILPIALIVLFSFCMFSLSRNALKVPQPTSDHLPDKPWEPPFASNPVIHPPRANAMQSLAVRVEGLGLSAEFGFAFRV